MFVLVSPAKKLDFDAPAPFTTHTTPEFLDDSNKLITQLKKLTKKEIAELLKISENLAELNYKRYRSFKLPFTIKNSKQAIYAFKGDTYVGLDAESLNEDEISYAQKHLRILSGLYGCLAPLDLIQAYRLEMGTNFKTKGASNLYAYWQDKVTKSVNKAAKNNEYLVNCASKEYFSAIDQSTLAPELIDPKFLVNKNNEFKVIGIYAKKARGALARYIIKNKAKRLSDLYEFNDLGFKYCKIRSSGNSIVFTKKN